ncbi:MAG: hypothetical protein K1Y36_08370, partial [Blastocatellia bacterium]|nr:hypothetical protein [Blastocatellia bacterium]
MKRRLFSGPDDWKLWFTGLALMAGLHLITFSFSPNIWVDEVQITEYGRVALEPHSSWSIVWQTTNGKPLQGVTYPACVLQELAWQVTGSHLGPRIFSLFGAMVAATLLVGWLRARGGSGWTVPALGVLFFLDPYLMVSYRFGRVDSWSLAVLFALAWMLWSLLSRPAAATGLPQKVGLLVGIGTVINFFIWPTSAVFFPLLLAEGFLASQGKPWLRWDVGSGSRLAGWFLGSAALGLILLLLPIGILNGNGLGQSTMAQAQGDYLCYTGWSGGRLLENLKSLETFCRFCPLFPLALVAGLVLRTKWVHWVAFLLAFLAISASRVYLFRVIYLLPFIFILLATIFQQLQQPSEPKKRIGRLTQAGLLLMVAWSCFFAAASWVVAPFYYKAKTDPNLLLQAGMHHIGTGPRKVFLDNFGLSFYYAGRNL